MADTRRILIVDDEPNVRLVFSAALQADGHEALAVGDGETALELLRRESAALVLLDLRMPGPGGLEVLRRFRDEGLEDPVIVVTAHGSIPDAVEAMRLGAVDFLSKPLTPEALRAAVSAVLARHAGPAGDGPEPPRGSPGAMLQSAKRALNHRLFDRAEVLLDAVVELAPGDVEALVLLGTLHEVRNRNLAARATYKGALAIDPGHALARLGLERIKER